MELSLQDGDTVVILRPTQNADFTVMSATISPETMDAEAREYFFVLGSGLCEVATNFTEATLSLGAHAIAECMEAEEEDDEDEGDNVLAFKLRDTVGNA